MSLQISLSLLAFVHPFFNLFVMQTKKLNASESTLKSLETSLSSVSREKEDLGMVNSILLSIYMLCEIISFSLK